MRLSQTRRALGRPTLAVAAALASLGRRGVAAADEESAPLEEALAQAGDVSSLDVPAESSAEPVTESPTPPEPAPPEFGPPAMSELELIMLALVNGARLARNIPQLDWDATMAEVARAHAQDMMSRGVVSHTGADGSSPVTRLRQAGVRFQFGSENIWTYWGRVPDQGPATMHASMMAEPWQPGLWNHIGNILHTGYRRIGIGIVVNPNGVQYLSEVFAD